MPKNPLLTWIALVCSLRIADAVIQVLDPSSLNIVDSFYDQEITPTTIEGYIELANPSDACDYIKAPTFPANLTMNRIALMNDTNCNLITKICFAESVGYDTVVLFHSQEYSLLLSRLILDLKLKIREGEFKDCLEKMSVVFIFSDDASVIINNYLYQPSSNQNYLIRIIPSNQSWAIQALLSFAVWALPLLAISLFCALVRNLTDRFRQWRIKQFMQGRSALGRLRRLFPTVNFSEGDPYESCIICLSHFTIGEKLRVLACSHAYHPDCIDAWVLKHRRRCPICNRKVLLGDSFDELDPDPSENTPLLTPTQVHDSTYISTTASSQPNDTMPDEHSISPVPIRQSTELLSPLQGPSHDIQLNMEAGNNNSSENQQALIV